jgi:hypothetical protein
MYLQGTTQCQLIPMTYMSLTSQDPEVNQCPMAPPFDVWHCHLALAASLWDCDSRYRLFRSARSRSLRLQHVVLRTTCHLSVPHLWSDEASSPMDCIRSTASLMCCTQLVCRVWLIHPASVVSHSECGRKPRIRTHTGRSTMASSKSKSHTESPTTNRVRVLFFR